MAEYNMNYMNLRKRLLTLKIVTESDMSLIESSQKSRLNLVDGLLKDLDNRYSENQPLSVIEYQVDVVESEIKK